ncbi:VRR-NUC domain-containing protein [Candidatus Dojkabacteria bacterium]|jgi:hypothetical protein|nr:VRR-NUC domain-containing protein [Candidatus Dojkabacteria bacterium]
MKSPSNELTSSIIDFLLRNRFFAWRQNTTGVYDPKNKFFRPASITGVSDIIAIRPQDGRFVAIEVKIGHDKLRESQIAFLGSVERAKGIAVVVKTFDEFLDIYNKFIVYEKQTKI